MPFGAIRIHPEMIDDDRLAFYWQLDLSNDNYTISLASKNNDQLGYMFGTDKKNNIVYDRQEDPLGYVFILYQDGVGPLADKLREVFSEVI